jgi:hypothetical protein
VTVNPADVPNEPPLVHWRAVFAGALAGLCVVVGASVADAILDHNIDTYQDSGWRYLLFVVILFGYALAGWQAGRMVPDAFLTNGALAGVGAFVLWIPVRIAIWFVRDDQRGLFDGHRAALRPGQLFGQLVIASALGMLGGFIGARAAARARGDAS